MPSNLESLEPVENNARKQSPDPIRGPEENCASSSILHSNFFTPKSGNWTDILPKTKHVDYFRNASFEGTSLGAVSDWGPSLRLYSSMLFADSRGAVIFWGPDWVSFYNEPYAPCYGSVHPGQMGKPFRVGFPEVWDEISAIFEKIVTSADTLDVHNIPFFLERNNYIEETYFIGQFIPLRGDSGEIEGIYNTVYESTADVLHKRWRPLIDEVAAIPPFSVDDTMARIMGCLQSNPKDVPMAMLFSFDPFIEAGQNNLFLHSTIGQASAPKASRLDTCHDGIVAHLWQAKSNTVPYLITQSVCEALFHDVEWCGHGEPSTNAIIMPLSNAGTLLGFYVQGINPRRPYDEAVQQNVVDIVRQIEAKCIASQSVEKAKQREMMLERRASDSETRLRHMAQCAPLGMYQVGADFEIRYSNEQFWDITGLDRAKCSVLDLVQLYTPEDRVAAIEGYKSILKGAPRLIREHRLNRLWSGSKAGIDNDEKFSAWILASSFPLIADGKVKLIMGYVSDISQQKWAEAVQSRNAATATEAKRRQEHFIDTTSHEMRNPLNAITQLADGIRRSLDDMPQSSEEQMAIIRDNVDAATTILTCTSHQKRVIDDVLTLSRLESQMLSITPVPGQPEKVVQDVFKMLEADLASAEITADIQPVQKEGLEHVNTVLIDTSRLMQILLNFVTNSIKFMASQCVRNISVEYGIQAERPPLIETAFGSIDWIRASPTRLSDTAISKLHHDSQKLYLYFCIKDTGVGMTPDEVKRLFNRFSQGSPRTHINYGGSGLGLHICRQLVELQGGGVGVVSQRYQGSAFGFYVETIDAKLFQPEPTPRSGTPNSDNQFATSNGNALHHEDDEVMTGASQEEPNTALNGSATSLRTNLDTERLDILLVEDNLVNQRVLAKQLKAKSASVLVANNGREALDILRTTNCWHENSNSTPQSNAAPKVDIILMDWEMPELNGLECTERIRQLEKEGTITRRLFIVGITANVRHEQIEQALAAGMDTVVGKPFTVQQLFNKLKKCIG